MRKGSFCVKIHKGSTTMSAETDQIANQLAPPDAAMEAGLDAQNQLNEAVAPTGEADSMKFVSGGVKQLRQEAPEVWDAMTRGIAHEIISGMRRHQARMKQIIKGQP